MLSNLVLLALALASPFFVGAQSIAGKCTGQSCYVATLSGSTGTPYKQQGSAKPKGGNAKGDKCIKSYYQKLGLPPPEGLKRFGRIEGEPEGYTRRAKLETVRRYLQGEKQQAGGCKPNSLIFARGTTEPAGLGISVGPVLNATLTLQDSKWYVEPVVFDATIDANYCLGMAGGYACMGQLDKLVAKCPTTKIIVGGYSQGAMVARIGAAFAKEETKKQIKGLVLFGDPFNGAPVKGFPQEKVHTICNDTDGVCKGLFSITAGHLTYTGTGTIGPVVKWMNQAVAS